ncbi:regulator of chromosome condensation [Anaeramoeba ignava]|uniref:Regulator of chromosome condensation n=1 Tax=Anaeramoeba ignava TaxID=1746090 RepID=A0A9Q0R7I9_ANAIG|nr:regulator of chromosome condensation [Anaeramoeba ignava]
MNEILFFGLNKNPKLIKNEPDEITKPIQFKFENENENENEKQIKQISTGDYSTIFLFKNGKAIEYLFNSNQNPRKIQIEENIQKVTVGYRNEAILTIEGNVFAKGRYINSKNSKEFINISSLIQDPNDRIIEDVVSGSGSIYLLTSNQNAYGIGDIKMVNLVLILTPLDSLKNQRNIKRRKIHKLTQIQNIPNEKIIDIQCGFIHSIMLIEDENLNLKRKLCSCGYYHYNGLGKNENTYEFTEIKSSLFENDDNILDFSVGNAHTLILTSKSKLIGFGNNFNAQLGTGDTNNQLIPIQIELPELRFNEDISNYHIYCGGSCSFLYYSPPSFSNLEEDLIKLFRRKEFCNISFKTENGEIIEAHKLILKYRLNQNQNEIEKLQEIISNKSIKESNQIFEMIYSNNSKINPKLYSEI